MTFHFLLFIVLIFSIVKFGVGVGCFLLSNRMLQKVVFVFEMFNCCLFNLKKCISQSMSFPSRGQSPNGFDYAGTKRDK